MTWRSLTDPSQGGKLHTIAVEKDIFLGGVGHVWVSPDLGATWSEIGQGLPPAPILGISVNAAGEVIVGTGRVSSATSVLYPASVCRFTGGAWIKDATVKANLKIADFQRIGDKLYLATAYNGDIYESTDEGHTWHLYAVNAVIRTPANSLPGALWKLGVINDKLAASGELKNGIFIDPQSMNAQWGNIGPFDVDGYLANEAHWLQRADGTIYAGRKHSSGHYVSRLPAGAGKWQVVSGGLAPWQVVTALCEDAVGVLWESQQSTASAGKPAVGSVYSSRDGVNWSPNNAGLPMGAIASTLVAGHDQVYALTQTGIYAAPAGG